MVHTKFVSLFSSVILGIASLFVLAVPAFAAEIPVSRPSSYVDGTNYYLWYDSDYGNVWRYIEIDSNQTSIVFKSNSGETLTFSDVNTKVGHAYTFNGSSWSDDGNSNVGSPAYPTFVSNIYSNLPVVYNDPSYPTLQAFYLTQFNYTDLTYPITNNTVLFAPPVAETGGIVYNDPVISASNFDGVSTKITDNIGVAVPIAFGVLALLYGLRLAIKYFRGIAR